ncbi:hypothetical protein CDD83_8774 [Cordyceps sp. RAO-2017]|nr:hypothetical protein CDD83_8774 [Cordyceps sp. RAO-2017]
MAATGACCVVCIPDYVVGGSSPALASTRAAISLPVLSADQAVELHESLVERRSGPDPGAGRSGPLHLVPVPVAPAPGVTSSTPPAGMAGPPYVPLRDRLSS